MGRPERKAALQKLETCLGYRVISYVTSTRPNLAAQMNADAVRYVYEQLRPSGSSDAIGLLIHSHGGEPSTSWRLMNLLREFAAKVVVLVPYQAFSAATLLALGADEILMHPMAALGPTDPSIVGPFNPKDPAGQPLPVSVEDVLSYIALVKEDVRINHEDELVLAFSDLVKQVHPLALGSVKRSHSQGKLLAKKLMQLRQSKLDDHKINDIVDSLTSKLYYHGHPINRVEADLLELPVVKPAEPVEKAMWDAYEHYERDMHLSTEFEANVELRGPAAQAVAGQQQQLVVDVSLPLVYVESVRRCDVFAADLRLTGTRDNVGGITGARIAAQSRQWREEK